MVEGVEAKGGRMKDRTIDCTKDCYYFRDGKCRREGTRNECRLGFCLCYEPMQRPPDKFDSGDSRLMEWLRKNGISVEVADA